MIDKKAWDKEWQERKAAEDRLSRDLKEMVHAHLGKDRRHDVRIVLYPKDA